VNAEQLRDLGFQLEGRAPGGESGGASLSPLTASREPALCSVSPDLRRTALPNDSAEASRQKMDDPCGSKTESDRLLAVPG